MNSTHLTRLALVLVAAFSCWSCYRYTTNSSRAGDNSAWRRRSGRGRFADENSLGKKTSRLPIVPETFLYMSMGSGHSPPNNFTYQRGCLPGSALLFLTFKKAIDSPKAEEEPHCNVFYVHFPKSTWTTGRNELLRQAVLLEAKQGWCYEFFIFTDHDAKLVSRTNNANKDGDQLFRQMLTQYRPIRASVVFGDIPVAPVDKRILACAQITFTDAIVDAYHRTGVDLLLPYVGVLDGYAWPMSAYITNIFAAVVAPQHCHVYRQLTIANVSAEHAKYPREGGPFQSSKGWVAARRLVNWHLSALEIPGFHMSQPLAPKIQFAMFGTGPNGSSGECRPQPKGVDYADIVPHRVAGLRHLFADR